jgi:hypothetical protein
MTRQTYKAGRHQAFRRTPCAALPSHTHPCTGTCVTRRGKVDTLNSTREGRACALCLSHEVPVEPAKNG